MLISTIVCAQVKNAFPLSLTVECDLNEDLNVIGLCLIKYRVINHSNLPVKINRPEHWAFIGYIEGEQIYFSQREATTFNIHDITLNPNDSMIVEANLNLFDFLAAYEYTTGKSITKATKIAFCATINSLFDKTEYYSQKIKLTINPLTKNDNDAFDFIKSKEMNPYEFTARGNLTHFGLPRDIVGELMTNYPESTFAELASLSLAYQRARESKAKPELRSQVNQFLEKPLASKYTFVRYLAEELKKKQ